MLKHTRGGECRCGLTLAPAEPNLRRHPFTRKGPMNIRRIILWIAAAAIITSPAILLLIVPPPAKADRPQNVFHSERARSKVGDAGDETAEALAAAEQYAQARTAPGVVLPGAYGAAFAALSTLPVAGGTWAEVTNRPYDSDDPRYRDPFYSNSSGGSGLVAGRITGLAVGNGAIYAGGADGGVFRSRDGGSTWTPLTDKLPTLSVGDVKLGSDGALWLATGEGNTGATAYVGSGVYRVTKPLTDVFTTATRVGGSELESTFIHRL